MPNRKISSERQATLKLYVAYFKRLKVTLPKALSMSKIYVANPVLPRTNEQQLRVDAEATLAFATAALEKNSSAAFYTKEKENLAKIRDAIDEAVANALDPQALEMDETPEQILTAAIKQSDAVIKKGLTHLYSKNTFNNLTILLKGAKRISADLRNIAQQIKTSGAADAEDTSYFVAFEDYKLLLENIRAKAYEINNDNLVENEFKLRAGEIYTNVNKIISRFTKYEETKKAKAQRVAEKREKLHRLKSEAAARKLEINRIHALVPPLVRAANLYLDKVHLAMLENALMALKRDIEDPSSTKGRREFSDIVESLSSPGKSLPVIEEDEHDEFLTSTPPQQHIINYYPNDTLNYLQLVNDFVVYITDGSWVQSLESEVKHNLHNGLQLLLAAIREDGKTNPVNAALASEFAQRLNEVFGPSDEAEFIAAIKEFRKTSLQFIVLSKQKPTAANKFANAQAKHKVAEKLEHDYIKMKALAQSTDVDSDPYADFVAAEAEFNALHDELDKVEKEYVADVLEERKAVGKARVKIRNEKQLRKEALRRDDLPDLPAHERKLVFSTPVFTNDYDMAHGSNLAEDEFEPAPVDHSLAMRGPVSGTEIVEIAYANFRHSKAPMRNSEYFIEQVEANKHDVFIQKDPFVQATTKLCTLTVAPKATAKKSQTEKNIVDAKFNPKGPDAYFHNALLLLTLAAKQIENGTDPATLQITIPDLSTRDQAQQFFLAYNRVFGSLEGQSTLGNDNQSDPFKKSIKIVATEKAQKALYKFFLETSAFDAWVLQNGDAAQALSNTNNTREASIALSAARTAFAIHTGYKPPHTSNDPDLTATPLVKGPNVNILKDFDPNKLNKRRVFFRRTRI